MHVNKPSSPPLELTPLTDAQHFVIDACGRLDPVTVPRREAVGLALAESISSTEVVPPFDNTAVDGYAVRSNDVAEPPVVFTVVGEIAAGAAPSRQVDTGEAIRIMTGAPMPPGADAVVMVEDSEPLGADGDGVEHVRLHASVKSGAAVRRSGEDVKIGDELFTPGTEITPVVAGVLASVNATDLVVRPRARVAVLSTGDELVDDGGPLELGQIRESNKTTLTGLLAEAGCDVVDFGIVRDDEQELENVLRRAAQECDAIVTSGGVSMGDHEVVKLVLGRIAEVNWMQLAMKPGKPFAFGQLDGTPVFGLPGNPVSSMVSFELLARPALRYMMGHTKLTRTIVMGVTDEPLLRSSDGKIHFVRVVGDFGPDGRYHVRPVAAQGSHQLARTAKADALAVLPDGPGVDADSALPVILLR